MGDFRMPVLGADMEAGTVVEWRVEPGDVVHHGDIIAVVDTDKSTIEVEVFEDGVVEELLVAPGVEVAVGTPLARLRSEDGEIERAALAPSFSDGRAFVRASPMARRTASAVGVDLGELAGSGPGGVVVARDVAAVTSPGTALPVTPPSPERPADEPQRRRADMRRAVGALMARSAQEIPHYYLSTTIDLGAATDWLKDTNEDRPVTERVLPAAVLFRAVALAARETPRMNGFWTDDEFVPSQSVHLGVAVSLRSGGLIAPAIRDADQLGVHQLMAALRSVVQRARAGILRSSDLTDPTITITNLGDQGVDEVFGVIYPPQVALVGFGKVTERPWARDGMLGVRPVVRATLAADHRASDGIEGARFLGTIDRLLQTPEDL